MAGEYWTDTNDQCSNTFLLTFHHPFLCVLKASLNLEPPKEKEGVNFDLNEFKPKMSINILIKITFSVT